jgi:septum formation protein
MLLKRLEKYEIILASQSPRRSYLLTELGIKFRVSDLHVVDETYPSGLNKAEIPVFLSELKSDTYTEDLTDNQILITADTIVWFGNNVINKPVDRLDAIKILNKLQGNMHEVVTGVTLKSSRKKHSFFSHSEVYFAPLSEEEIIYYVDKFNPVDKAGAYGIQEWIGYAGIKEIRGSYFNVMGLPVQKLYTELNNFINF